MTTLAIDPGSRSSIAAALADQQRRDHAQGAASWRDTGLIGQALGISGYRLQAEIDRAERRGLVECRELVDGTRIALTDLGAKLFGLGGPGSRLRPDPGSDSSDPDPRPALVQLLIRWRSATPLVQVLADHLGRDVEPVWDEILELQGLGWVETWPDHPAGPTVMLSSRAADQAGLRLSCDASRWLRPRDPDETSIEPRRVDFVATDLDQNPGEPGILETLPDPRGLTGPEALQALEEADRLGREILDRWTDPDETSPVVLDHRPDNRELWDLAGSGRPRIFLPDPKVLLGERLPWPVRPTPGEPCRGCGSGPLSRSRYCLVCDRSGIDDLIQYLLTIEPAPARIRKPRPERPAPVERTARPGRAAKVPRVRPASGIGTGLRGGLGSG